MLGIVTFLVFQGAATLALATEPIASDRPPVATNRPIDFQADELTYDSETKVYHATGNVEAIQGQRRMTADSVTFDSVNNIVTAEGNVVLYEPTGEVIHAERVQLTGDLANGIMTNMRAILADGAIITAAKADRSGGYLTTFKDASYTPCFLCANRPDAAPLWRVRSVKVTSNREKKIVEFSHSWLEIRGVPIAYIPYFYQPDPSVKRKTGLLIPSFGQTSNLGTVVQVPIYVVLSDQADATITPWYTSAEGPVLQGEYRQALRNGDITAEGSITYDSEDRVRGHIFSENRYDIDDNWRGGLDVRRTSGRAYLREYGFNSSRSLTSKLYGEGFYDRDYAHADMMAFQNLEDNVDQDTVPYVTPYADYYYSGIDDVLGGSTDMRVGTAILTRKNGEDTRRLTARGQWQRPVMGPYGSVLEFGTALWADGYDVSEQQTETRQNKFNGQVGRVFPQANARVRMPFVREGKTTQQIVEPVAEVVLAPSWGNPSRIPNEDSQDFELQDTNLFGFNRLPGVDVVDKGPRVNYGLNWSLFGSGSRSASAFIGQSYSVLDQNSDSSNGAFGKGTGLQGNVSDVVGMVDLRPASWVDVIYRNRLDDQTLAFHRNELTTRIGVPALRMQGTYVRYEERPQNDLRSREEVDYAVDARLTRFWRSRVYGVTDIESESQREIGLRLTYEDECFIFSTTLARQNFRDGDVNPRNIIFFRVGFKTLGQVGTSVNAPGGGN